MQGSEKVIRESNVPEGPLNQPPLTDLHEQLAILVRSGREASATLIGIGRAERQCRNLPGQQL